LLEKGLDLVKLDKTSEWSACVLRAKTFVCSFLRKTVSFWHFGLSESYFSIFGTGREIYRHLPLAKEESGKIFEHVLSRFFEVAIKGRKQNGG
jgi:hypothetical protein